MTKGYGTMTARMNLGRLSPFKLEGAEIYPTTLLVCKLLWVTTMLHGIYKKFSVPFLPIFKPLDYLLPMHDEVSGLLLGCYLFFGGLLVFNVRPRLCLAVLGGALLILLLANKPVYRNHLFIVSSVFLLSSLHRKNEKPKFLIYQFAIVYLAASTNKLFEADWRSGQFMSHYLGGNHGWYDFLVAYLPESLVNRVLCFSVITYEVIIGIFFLIRKTRSTALLMLSIFQIGMYAMLEGETFGYFFYDIMVLSLAGVTYDYSKGRFALPRLMYNWSAERIALVAFVLLVSTRIVIKILPEIMSVSIVTATFMTIWLVVFSSIRKSRKTASGVV